MNLDLALKNNPENYQLEGNIYSPQGFIGPNNWFENYNLEYLLNFKISAGNLSVISKFLDLPSKNISGNLNLNSSFYGTLKKPQFKVEAIFENLKIEKTRLALLESNLSFKEGELSFDKFIIKDKDNISQIKGNLGEENNLEINLKNLNLNFLEAFLYKKFSLNGELSLNLNLKGNIFKPLIDSKFQILKGDFQGFKFDSFKGEIQGKDGFIVLNNWKIKRGKHLATGAGRIPLIWKKGKYLSASPLDVKINLEEDDLDFFNIFGDLIRKSKGKLFGELKFSGPLTQINTQGEIKIDNAEAQFTSLDNTIKKLNLSADLNQNILTIKKFEGESEGKFNLNGKILLSSSLANNLNLSLSLKNFLIINPKYFQGRLNGDIYLKEDLNKSNLWGTLKISDGSLNLYNFKNKTSQEIKISNKTFSPELALDLHLERVWINNQASILRTFLKSSGVLEFRGRFPNPTLQGNLDFSQGQIIFYNSNFKVTDGKAYFDASNNWDPNIEIDAETSISGNKIYLGISGNINRPVWEAHSDPPLSKQEITQLLAGKFIPLIGQTGEENVSQKEFSQYLMGTLQMNLIQPFFNVLEQNLSFGDLSFEYILPGFWSIKIAKALDKDDKFYLTYSRVFGISGEIYKLWGLEYKLQRKMILRISQDIKNNFIFSIQSHYNF
ncbi:MAG: translocation/assembly module TamB domain-containing protein [Armatimonadetes bacterium]|nr:translocation/assembly module TamB domain-containing protein [Armatimonadota bacterium]